MYFDSLDHLGCRLLSTSSMIGVGGICVCLKASLQGFAHQQLITESGEASIGVSRLQQPAWGGGAGVFMGQPGHIFPAGGAWIIRTPALETQPNFDENL